MKSDGRATLTTSRCALRHRQLAALPSSGDKSPSCAPSSSACGHHSGLHGLDALPVVAALGGRCPCSPFAALGQAAFSGAFTAFGGPADSPRSPLARVHSGLGANSPPELRVGPGGPHAVPACPSSAPPCGTASPGGLAAAPAEGPALPYGCSPRWGAAQLIRPLHGLCELCMAHVYGLVYLST